MALEVKKKILIIHPALAPYRIDFFNLLNNYFQVELLLLHENISDNPFDQNYLKSLLNFPVSVTPALRRFLNQPIPTGLHRRINEFKPDIVIGSEFAFFINQIILLRIVHRYHCKIFTITDDNEFRIHAPGSFLRRLNRDFLCKFLDGVITLDIAEVKAFYQQKCGFERTTGVHHLIREADKYLKVFGGPGDPGERIHESRGRKVNMLFVGRLVSEKGIDVLVKAFARLATFNQEIVLRIVGDGKEKEAIMSLVKVLGMSDRILFAGRQEGNTLRESYRRADLFILPSRYEPFGAVVNEALLAGLPVICSDHVGAKCLVREGISGSVFINGNVESLTDKMAYWTNRLLHEKEFQRKSNLMNRDAVDEVSRLAGFLLSRIGDKEC